MGNGTNIKHTRRSCQYGILYYWIYISVVSTSAKSGQYHMPHMAVQLTINSSVKAVQLTIKSSLKVKSICFNHPSHGSSTNH